MLTILSALLLSPSMAGGSGQDVRFSGLLPENRLVLEVRQTPGQPLGLPISLNIQLCVGNAKPRTIRKLEDLAGHVLITSQKQALDYVRLRTSLSTWDLCWDGDLEAEITSTSIARHAANYGIVSDLNVDIEGWLGVISDQHFKHCKIAPAKVSFDHNGFTVTRSLLTFRGPALKIEEHVDGVGNYRRKIQESFSPSKGYSWFFPLKE